ncbi:MAG: polysaccharide biosynthesis transport protein [Desulfobacteraceae bacterium Eth-SRB1]|nr:MAG: polysaccharide biosynthesis transport protein [Desulfobacteraceae bacterium Eth-SRB1]
MMDENNTAGEEINIKEYLDVILKWRWVVITFFLVVVVTVAIHSFLARPEYQSTVRVTIEKENPNIISIQEVLQMDASQADYMQTQVDIFKSRSLANEVIMRMNLEESPEFKELEEETELGWIDAVKEWIKSVKDWVKSFFIKDEEKKEEFMAEEAIYSPIVGAYLGRLEIEPIRRTRLIDISFVGYNPGIITKIANEHVQAYIDKNLELKFQAAQDAISWLSKKLSDIKNRLTDAENTLQHFKEKEDIVSLGDIVSLSTKGDSIIHQKISELNSALTEARIKRLNLETIQKRLKKIEKKPEMIESFPNIIDNPLINNLKKSLADLLREKSELREKYGEKHPKIMALNAEIKQQENKIIEQIAMVAKSISTRYEIAFAQEKSIYAEMEREKKKAKNLTRKSIQFSVLQREVESNKQIYNTLLTRMKETSLTSGLNTSNLKIIDRAEAPILPIKPKKKRNILLAIIVGLAMGTGMAFFLEYMDDSIESPEDIEKHLKIPFLGPLAYVKNPKKNSEQTKWELFALNDPKSTTAEALRNIRTNISFRLKGKDDKSLVITSANPGEGKTLFAINMAILFASMGKKTGLIDADMRKPRIDKLVNIDRTPGLSDALIGEVQLSSIIKQVLLPNLYVIPAGTLPPNPAELLTSEKMDEFQQKFNKTFDIIIYDTPPMMSVTDSLILSKAVGNTVLIIKGGETERKAVKHAARQLEELDAKILGTVLNEVAMATARYYGKFGKYGKYSRYYRNYRRYYKYDYYYTEDGEKKKKQST